MSNFTKQRRKKGFWFSTAAGHTLYESWAREFEQRFPGIKVIVKAGSSNVLDEEIDAQMKAGHLQVDMAILQTIQDYKRWKKKCSLAV